MADEWLVRELVSAGLGVAILARSAAYATGPRVAALALVPEVRHPPIGVIHRRDRGLTAAAALCRHLEGAPGQGSTLAGEPSAAGGRNPR